jgi:hypothetical protein
MPAIGPSSPRAALLGGALLLGAGLPILGACSGEAASAPASEPTPVSGETAAASAPAAAAPTEAPAAAPSPGGIPAGESPPAGAPSLAGFEFPSFGTLREGAKAFFPARETAERLAAGTVDAGGNTWFRGEVVSIDAAAATATVRDLQRNEYPVPLSYVIQAREPVTSVSVGQVYLGTRFNRGELVMVTDATPNERGQVATIGLAPQIPDGVRPGSDALDELVPVVDGGIGSQAMCRGPNGVRAYTVLRRAPGSVLGHDGLFVRVLPEAACRFAPLRPELSEDQTVFYASGQGHREGTVRSVDAATGAVQVAYAWGGSEREQTVRFGTIVTELPPAE